MAVYVLADLDVHDAKEFEEYRRHVTETITRHGGRYVIRGGQAETVEGDWRLKRVTMLEFPSVEQFRAWYHSADYQAIIGSRHRAAKTNLILVHGGAAG